MEIEVKVKGMTRAKDAFQKLARNVNDLTPVWKEFLEWHKTEYMPQTWESQGKAQGKKWENYRSLRYINKKGKKSADLKLRGKLYDAARGKSGWYEKIQKKLMTFGVSDSIGGRKLSAAHQYGYKPNNIAQRSYLFTREDTLSPRAWKKLLDIIEAHTIKGTK